RTGVIAGSLRSWAAPGLQFLPTIVEALDGALRVRQGAAGISQGGVGEVESDSGGARHVRADGDNPVTRNGHGTRPVPASGWVHAATGPRAKRERRGRHCSPEGSLIGGPAPSL